MLVHLHRQTGDGLVRPTKNGPALAGYGAITMKDALVRTFETLPADMGPREGNVRARPSDAGTRVACLVYFADAKSPWQRGSNEHLNWLFRQFFPKGTDISRWSAPEIQAVADIMNNRPTRASQYDLPAGRPFVMDVGGQGVVRTGRHRHGWVARPGLELVTHQ
jgi:hypothetical protein